MKRISERLRYVGHERRQGPADSGDRSEYGRSDLSVFVTWRVVPRDHTVDVIDETGGVNDRLPFAAAESADTLATVRLDPDLEVRVRGAGHTDTHVVEFS